MRNEIHWITGEAHRIETGSNSPRVAYLLHPNGLGDCVHALPALAAVVARGDDILVSARPYWAGILERCGIPVMPYSWIHPTANIWRERQNDFGEYYSLTAWCYEHEDETQGNPFLSRVETFAKLIGVSITPPFPYRERLTPGDFDQNEIGTGAIVAGIGSTQPQREYPFARGLAAEIAEFHDGQILFIGDRPGETFFADVGDLIVALLRAPVVIATDNGILNLAAALGRPVVGIFGPTDPQTILHEFSVWSENDNLRHVSAPAQAGEPCRRPCHFQRRHGYNVDGRCKTNPPRAICISDVLPFHVAGAVRAALAQTKTRV